MRGVKLLAVTISALFALTAVAQATSYGLKIDAAGPRIGPETHAEAVFKITAPAEATKCKWTEPVGEVEHTNEPVLELGFNEEHITAEECEGAGQKHGGFTGVTVESFFGALIVSSSEKGARVRLAPGSTCVYKIITMANGALTLPAAFEGTFTAFAKKYSGNSGCPAEHEFVAEGTIKPEKGVSEEPFELVEF
jgi:hypothetical protein